MGPLYNMDDEGLALLVREMNEDSSMRRSSPSASVVDAVTEAVSTLESTSLGTGYEVVVFSDGFDTINITNYANWLAFNKMREKYQAVKASGRMVRVHTFALGTKSDRFLLKAIANYCGGDFSYASATQDGLSTLRSWFLRHIANQKSKVATQCRLSVKCRHGIRLKHFDTYDLVFDPKYVHKYDEDPEEGELVIEDFSEGHTSNIVLTLGIPQSAVNEHLTELADIKVTYTNAVTGGREEVKRVAVLRSSNCIVKRASHHWLPQFFILSTEGSVYVSGSGGTQVPVTGGGLVDKKDTVEVKRGKAVFMGADGSQFILVEKSLLIVQEVDGATLSSSFTLQKGSLYIATGQEAEVEVKVLEPRHVVRVHGHSYCKVSLDHRTKLAKVSCMYGTVTIVTTKEEGRPPSLREVLALRQTQMTDRSGPIAPWAIEDDSFQQWLAVKGFTSDFLRMQLMIGVHICRVIVAEWIGRAAAWLLKGSWDRVTETKANRRCREFLIRFFLAESKHFLTNNLAGLSPDTEEIRKYVDKAISIAMGSDQAKRRDKHTLYYLQSVAASLKSERAKGLCDAYNTPLQKRLFAECADAKAKEEREREAAERDRQRLMRDSEASRREKILHAIFPICDMDGVGAVNYAAMQQIILSLELLPWDVRTNVDTALPSALASLLARWQVVLAARRQVMEKQANCFKWGIALDFTGTAGGFLLDEGGFVKLWTQLTADCDTPGFNVLMEHVTAIVEELAELNEGTRRSRSLYSLFRMWDSDGVGYINFHDLFDVLQQVHGMSPFYSTSCERMLRVVTVGPPSTVKSSDKPKNIDVSHYSTEVVPSIDDLGDLKITLHRFHLALAAFYERHTERAYHSAVEKIAETLRKRKAEHRQIAKVIKSLAREAEKEHLLKWDLRHVFDGMNPKDLARLGEMRSPNSPKYLHTIAAPVCILCGLVPPVKPGSAVDESAIDYWGILRKKLMRDADGLIDFLQNFPVLSVTYRQVLRVLQYLNSPDFDSCRVLSLSPPLAYICDWVKLVLKISFLQHGWDFSNRIVLDEPLTSLSRQTVAPKLITDANNEIEVAEPDRTREDSDAWPSRPVSRMSAKPHARVVLNRSFQGIVESDDPVERASSRFSHYDDQESTWAVQLTDPRLHSPLSRTMPVTLVSAGEKLPPAYISRLDPDCRPGTVQSSIQTETTLRLRAGRPGTALDGHSATGRPRSSFLRETNYVAAPHPPRPSSAPLAGRAARRPVNDGNAAHRTSALAISPAPPTAPRADGRSSEVAQWLSGHGLSELVEPMLREGYDDLVDLKELIQDDSDAKRLVPRPGHRRKLQRLLETV